MNTVRMGTIDPLGVLGRDFIGYVAACAPGAVDEALADPSHYAYSKVSAAVERCRQMTDSTSLETIHYTVGSFANESGVSYGNALRKWASGEDPPPLEPGTGILEPLGRVAREIYPALLIPSPTLPSLPSTRLSAFQLASVGLLNNPAAKEVDAALKADDSLMSLFSPEGSTGFIAFANGSGMGIGTDLFSTSVLGAATARARLMHPTFALDRLIEELTAVIGDLYAIVRGEEINLPVAVSLHGLDVQPGERMTLPWGTLLPLDTGVQSALGEAVGTGGAVFATTISSFVARGGATDQSPPTLPAAKMRAYETELETRIRKTTLALLLMDREPPRCGVATRSVAITPFFGMGWASAEVTPNPRPVMQSVLTKEDSSALQSAAALVDVHYAPSLAIPTRRLSSALMVRHDIEDGLVDAIVALESLFAGTDSGELTFRIGASVAWLIAGAAEERLELNREVGKLYTLRSKILHRGYAGQNVSKERDRTVQLGIASLRALLEDHPDLVGEENRGKIIIMRGEGPS